VSTWVEAACVIVVVYAGRLVMEVRYFVSAGKVRVRASMLVVTV
jgi:hypothetical protein